MPIPSIRRVCVVGAGTMGSGIAAHLANVGFEVSLLDATQHSVTEAFDRAKAAKPPHFYIPERANEIRLGNIVDHLHYAAEADWICEAIVERMDAKRDLFARLDEVIRPDAMITTNTSGLQIGLLAEGRSESFRRRFMGTHFFNPPRYLKLLELIPTDESDPEIVAEMARFLEEHAARRVVVAKDTPGFIANRFGMWAMFHAVHTAERLHLSVEQVDAITGPFLGRPRSGSFRLNDLVGLDVMRDIAANLLERCPNDPYIRNLELPNSVLALLGRGWIGEKAGRGYYRREGRELLALDLTTMAYRNALEPNLPSLNDLKGLPLGQRVALALDKRDEVGEFLRTHLVPVLQYANYLQEEISHSVLDFDRVMMWGFGWEMGPFGLIDAIGHERLGIPTGDFYRSGEQRTFAGGYVPLPSEPQYRTITDFPVIGAGDTFRLRDLGDGVTAVAITTKMGTITPRFVQELTELLAKGLNGFVLTSEARSFSVGFDLTWFLAAVQDGRMNEIESKLVDLQRLGEALETRNAVAAVAGHCLGGGFELAVSCPRIVALAESQIGLPEAKVGLLPAGRGATLMRMHNSHSAKRLCEIALTLTEGVTSISADHARTLGYLRPTDVTCYHPDRLLFEAKRAVQEGLSVSRPAWRPAEGPVSGLIERTLAEERRRGRLSEYDVTVGEHIKNVVARSTNYEESLRRERTEFADLCRRALTTARIKHMLETGKPLRN